jgi:glycosyltransferase involved in cell wall biosynthesis
VAGEAGAALVTDGSPEQMATATLRLLGDDGTWERTADAALRLAGTRFAMSRIADRLLEVYGLFEPSVPPSARR